MDQPDTFHFVGYDFDLESKTAHFRYGFDDNFRFEELVQFPKSVEGYDQTALDQALFLAFMLAGTSYYKAFPKVSNFNLEYPLDSFQANFFTSVYRQGLSQFAYENRLTESDLIGFTASSPAANYYRPAIKSQEPLLVLESGGKDSLLLTTLLKKLNHTTSYLYVGSSGTYPKLLDEFEPPFVLERRIDRENLAEASAAGGLNGHVPITYIISAYALIHAVLTGQKTVLLSIAHEGEEGSSQIGGLNVNHQWSKSWAAEQALQEYVCRYGINIAVGSPLRSLSELATAELFVRYCWADFGHVFSSCNLANYMQGQANQNLKWCKECPKCANNFLLFAPFVEPEELMSIFNGQNLLKKPLLLETWKGLLGVDGIMKPFECVGEVAELRRAFHMATAKWGESVYSLPFTVPASDFDYVQAYDSQGWAQDLLTWAMR